MNQISAIEERSHENTAVADDLEHGRHAVPLVKDPGDYRGKHRSEDGYLTN